MVLDNPELSSQIFEAARKHYVELDTEACQAIIDDVIVPLVDTHKRDARRALDLAIPAKTSIVQTHSAEYAKGATTIIDLVRKAIKEVL